MGQTVHDKTAALKAGQQAQARGDFARARQLFDAVRTADPAEAGAALCLSRLAFDEGDRDGCLAHLDDALRLAPGKPALWMQAADRFQHFGLTDRAAQAYDTAIALQPKAIAPRAEKARLLQLTGKFDAANTAFRKLIKTAPREAQLYRIALATRKLARNDPMIRDMKALWDDPRLPEAERVQLGFALAKAMEDTGRTEQVFRFLHRANGLQAQAHPHDEAAAEAEWQAVRAAQDGLLPATDGVALPRPVFITGLPRSGTTLFEQILGAHPQVHAGGEIGAGLRLAYQGFGLADAMRPVAPDSPDVASFAARFRAVLRREGGEAPVVTDKSIVSWLIFGLLAHALPGARFIVVHRDPRDIALSMYRNHFAPGTHRYASDLCAMALQIKRFRRAIAHWRAALPGVIHETRYEALVSDPETQSRALLDAAGLAWDPGVLDFHKRKGLVRTLSLAQVRAPVHAGRRAAWRAHETALAPFIEAWGDEPWD